MNYIYLKKYNRTSASWYKVWLHNFLFWNARHSESRGRSWVWLVPFDECSSKVLFPTLVSWIHWSKTEEDVFATEAFYTNRCSAIANPYIFQNCFNVYLLGPIHFMPMEVITWCEMFSGTIVGYWFFWRRWGHSDRNSDEYVTMLQDFSLKLYELALRGIWFQLNGTSGSHSNASMAEQFLGHHIPQGDDSEWLVCSSELAFCFFFFFFFWKPTFLSTTLGLHKTWGHHPGRNFQHNCCYARRDQDQHQKCGYSVYGLRRASPSLYNFQNYVKQKFWNVSAA